MGTKCLTSAANRASCQSAWRGIFLSLTSLSIAKGLPPGGTFLSRGFANKCGRVRLTLSPTFDLANTFAFAGAALSWKIGPSGV